MNLNDQLFEGFQFAGPDSELHDQFVLGSNLIQPRDQFLFQLETINLTSRIDRLKLLDIIKKNREKHHSVFTEALEGFRVAAIAQLESMVEEARRPKGKIQMSITLRQPIDQTATYDRVIMMLELSEDQQIVLGDNEFRNFVQDKWNWTREFSASNKSYVSGSTVAYLDSLEEE